MKHNFIKAFALASLLIASSASQAQESTDSPKGKPIVTVFGDAGAGFNDQGLSSMGFNLERAYLGYEHKLNSSWKAKVVYDMGKGDDNSLQRLGYVKNAEVDYSRGRLSVNIGLTSTAQFNVQEKFWGHRYVYKSLMDQCKWGSSADLGLMASYKVADWLSADVSVFNGEGYKKVQSDKHLLYGLGFTVKPIEGLTLRLYGDMKTQPDTATQCNLACFVGYKTKVFRLGAEYNMQFNHGNAEGRSLQAISAYGAYRLADHTELYARYDYSSSSASDSWTYAQDGNTAILGLHHQVNSFFSISPNLRLNQPASSSSASLYACVSAKINL